MRQALLAEYRKLVSTRMWWLVLIIMVAYLTFVSAAMAFAFTAAASEVLGDTGMPPLSGEEAAKTVYSLANPIGYVFPLLIGSLAFTSEFRYQTITSSLLVEPRRDVLLVAKLLASVAIGVVYGAVGTAAVVLGGAPILAFAGDGSYLGNFSVVTPLFFSVLVLTMWTIIGVAFGGLVTNQVAAIVSILAFTQFIEPIARVVGATVEPLSGVAQFLPGAAADAVLGASFFATLGPGNDLLPRWAGVLVLVGYALLFAALARMTTLRRDIA